MQPFATRLAAPKRTPWPDNPVPLALVITDLDIGGAERALVQLATRIDKCSWAPTVIGLAREGSLAADLRQADIPTLCLNVQRGRPQQAIRRLRCTLDQIQPRLIQSFLFHANLAVRLAASHRAGGPWIISGLRVAERQRRWHLWLDRATQHLACGSVCVSNGVRQFSIDHARLDPKRLIVIPNGVDLARIDQATPTPRPTLGIDESAPVVLFVGRLDPQKGIKSLLNAWAQISPLRPDAQLLLAGEGPERPRIEQWIASSPERRSSTHLLGQRPDVPGLLKMATLLVLPSLWEGMPNVVLEAMAAGLPVVATQVEGTEELVMHGETGWLVPPNDPASLSDAILEALSHPQAARQHGERGRLRVQEHFDLTHSIRAYQQLWANVLGLPGDRFDLGHPLASSSTDPA